MKRIVLKSDRNDALMDIKIQKHPGSIFPPFAKRIVTFNIYSRQKLTKYLFHLLPRITQYLCVRLAGQES